MERLAALDLAVVLDDLGAASFAAFSIVSDGARVERDEDDDLGTVADALLGLRDLLLRVTVGIVDHVRRARLLESGEKPGDPASPTAPTTSGQGSRTHMSAPAFELEDLPCATVVAVPAIAMSARPNARMSFFTPVPFVGACNSSSGPVQTDTERSG